MTCLIYFMLELLKDRGFLVCCVLISYVYSKNCGKNNLTLVCMSSLWGDHNITVADSRFLAWIIAYCIALPIGISNRELRFVSGLFLLPSPLKFNSDRSV